MATRTGSTAQFDDIYVTFFSLSRTKGICFSIFLFPNNNNIVLLLHKTSSLKSVSATTPWKAIMSYLLLLWSFHIFFPMRSFWYDQTIDQMKGLINIGIGTLWTIRNFETILIDCGISPLLVNFYMANQPTHTTRRYRDDHVPTQIRMQHATSSI